MKRKVLALGLLLIPFFMFGSEADLKIPELSSNQNHLLMIGLLITLLGMLFGLYQFLKVKKLMLLISFSKPVVHILFNRVAF